MRSKGVRDRKWQASRLLHAVAPCQIADTIRLAVDLSVRGRKERLCGIPLEPLSFVPGSIVPGRVRIPKIKLHKFCQNDFSGVAGLFLKRPEKPRKFAPLAKKRRGAGRFAAGSHAKGRFEVKRGRTRRPNGPRPDGKRCHPFPPVLQASRSAEARRRESTRSRQSVQSSSRPTSTIELRSWCPNRR
jgi:hypothetical protein